MKPTTAPSPVAPPLPAVSVSFANVTGAFKHFESNADEVYLLCDHAKVKKWWGTKTTRCICAVERETGKVIYYLDNRCPEPFMLVTEFAKEAVLSAFHHELVVSLFPYAAT